MSASTTRAGTRLLLGLAAGCACALVAALAVEYHSGVIRETPLLLPPTQPASPASPPGSPAPADPSRNAGSVASQVGDWTRIALARPLFSPSRRPAAVAQAGPQQPRLTGIVLGPAGARAIFAGAGEARGTIAAVGQQAGGWRVLAIGAGGVQVSGPSGVRTLHPTRDATVHDDNPVAGSGLPPHPSILDLLRSRPLRPGGLDMPNLPFSALASPAPP